MADVKEDKVNHPKHYAEECSIECIEAMVIAFGIDAVVAFCKCNAFKYIWRYKNKNGYEDLEKAIWYCDYGMKLARHDDTFSNLKDLIKTKKEK